jgi:hypothetical protein
VIPIGDDWVWITVDQSLSTLSVSQLKAHTRLNVPAL